MTTNTLGEKLKVLLDAHRLASYSIDNEDRSRNITGTCPHGVGIVLWRETTVPEYETLSKHLNEFHEGYHPERGAWSRVKAAHVEMSDIHEVFRTGYRERADGLCYFCGRSEPYERETIGENMITGRRR